MAVLTGGPAPHDPGGKIRIPLPPGMVGRSEFCAWDGGVGDTHRPILWREWGFLRPRSYVLFVGQNPSTASDRVNDPTVLREINMSKRWGYDRYCKVNVMDLRETSPTRLLLDGAVPRSPLCLERIKTAAQGADRIVLAFGTMDSRLRYYAEEAVRVLERVGKPLLCLGTTKDGSPRHPVRHPSPSHYNDPANLEPWKGYAT
jgi:hypothetical protein